MNKQKLLLAILFMGAFFSGCRSSGENNGDEESDFSVTSPSYGGEISYSAEPIMCSIHTDTQMRWKVVKVFHGLLPLDAEYVDARNRFFPYCDDTVLSNFRTEDKMTTQKYVCKKCCEERNGWISKNR